MILIQICLVLLNLEKGYKMSFENKLCVIKNENNLKVFKFHMIDKKNI